MRLGEGICLDAKEESKEKEQVIKEREEKQDVREVVGRDFV